MARWSAADLARARKRIAAEIAFEAELDPKPHPSPPRPATPILERHRGGLYPLVLLCRDADLPEPMPEWRFDAIRGWRFDYAWIYQKVAVEVDGGVWIGGRHNRGAGFIEDQRKLNCATLHGWRVLRYTPDRLGEAIDDLREILR